MKAKRDAELLILPTDAAVFEDEGFRPHAEKYAADESVFFKVRARVFGGGVKGGCCGLACPGWVALAGR